MVRIGMFLWLLLLAPSLVTYSLWAQQTQIQGRILDEQGLPIAGSTVILQTLDSVYLSGTVTGQDGRFSFAHAVDSFGLSVQHLAYLAHQATYIQRDVGDIVLRVASKTLDEVTVSTVRPWVTLHQDRFVYDASQIASRLAITSALDLIKRLPTILERDGKLTLIGASSLKIVLDGQPSTLPQEQVYQLLSTIPADRIDRIEVMHMAPQRYQVRGAVIDVILKRSHIALLSGSLQASYTDEHSPQGQLSGNILYDSPSLSLDFLYSPSIHHSKSYLGLTGLHIHQNTGYKINQEQTITTRTYRQGLRLGMKYSSDSSHRFTMAYTTNLQPNLRGWVSSIGTFDAREIYKESSDYMHNLSGQYSWGEKIEMGLDYTHYRYRGHQALDVGHNGITRFLDISNAQTARQGKFYLNGRLKIAAPTTLVYGASALWSQSRDKQIGHVVQGSHKPLLNLDAVTREHTYELYTGLETQARALSFSASLAASYYRHGGRGHWAIFPQLSVSYMANPRHILQLSLESDKDYAPYKLMQSSISYLDVYSQVHGNPNLRPMHTYRAMFNYVYRQRYILQLYSTYAKHHFEQSAYQDEESLSLIYQTLNWDYAFKTGSNAILSFNIGSMIKTRLTLGLVHTQLKINDFYGHRLNRSKLNSIVLIDNGITIPSFPKLSVDISGHYVSPSIQSNYDLTSLWAINLGIKYTLLQDKLTLSLRGNDLFETGSPIPSAALDSNRLRMDVKRYLRSVTLGVSYQFGRYKKPKHRQVDTSRFGG